jgi:hypothetical protein
MPAIGIIDDRMDFRTTLKRRIVLSLKKQNLNWDIIDIYPFEELQDYVTWIKQLDIAMLILDERLQEGNHEAKNVNYNGSKLIEFIRQILPEFPVFAITSYPNDEDLQERFPLFDEILSRDEFFKKPDDYALRFIRSAQRYLGIYSKQLIRMSEISELIATGKANKADVDELKALQQYLNIPFTAYSHANKEDWLKVYEGKIQELNELSKKIQSFIESKHQ